MDISIATEEHHYENRVALIPAAENGLADSYYLKYSIRQLLRWAIGKSFL